MSNVVHLPSAAALRTPVGHVIRTGEASYKQLEHLHAGGRLPATSVIFDASKVRFQKEFVQSLRTDGAELLLDTKVAELSELGRYRGAAKDAPWAVKDTDRPLQPQDFEAGSNVNVCGQIARYAVELGMTAVLAPTHYLREGAQDPWLAVDLNSVIRLRAALDREGGSHIAIDYPLVLSHTRLQDPAQRAALIQAIGNLPFDNLVVRLSGFGANAAPLSIKRTMLALDNLQALQRPIVLDHVGGLVGVGAVAYGFASGIAHGIGERDSFDARTWHQMPKERDPDASFGRTTFIPLPGFDRAFQKKDLEAIARVSGGRRLVSCQDRGCCPSGLTSLIDKPRAHIAFQKFRVMNELAEVPDTRRIGHFLGGEMRDAERKAGDLARLNTGDDKLNDALIKGRKRIDSMARMYETLAERERVAPPPMVRRAAAADATGRGAR